MHTVVIANNNNDMKVSIIVAVLALVACGASASKLSSLANKFMPSFATGYIIKGEDAAPHAAPYIVSLSTKAGAKHTHSCGGTIIDKKWILTAAHCISKTTQGVGMGVIAGLHQRSKVTDRTQSRVVDFGRIHESYGSGVGPFDIALLRVSQSFELNEWVQTATLPGREEIHSGESHLYGWGQPKAFQFSGAETLQTVETDLIDFGECKKLLPDDAPIAASNICSDSKKMGISACNGDSGGPLVVERDGASSELVGIVSWGYIPCGMGNMPSIYTRVSAYIDWVNKVQGAFYILH